MCKQIEDISFELGSDFSFLQWTVCDYIILWINWKQEIVSLSSSSTNWCKYIECIVNWTELNGLLLFRPALQKVVEHAGRCHSLWKDHRHTGTTNIVSCHSHSNSTCACSLATTSCSTSCRRGERVLWNESKVCFSLRHIHLTAEVPLQVKNESAY